MEENIKINTSEFKLNHHDHGGCNTTSIMLIYYLIMYY